MTAKQKQQFNIMYDALHSITKYDTPDRLRKHSRKDYGLEFEEALEGAYENIQGDAAAAIHGVRKLK